MAMGNGRSASLAARRAPAQSGHLGGCRGLIDDDQLLGIEIKLTIEPDYAAAKNVRALLL